MLLQLFPYFPISHLLDLETAVHSMQCTYTMSLHMCAFYASHHIELAA